MIALSLSNRSLPKQSLLERLRPAPSSENAPSQADVVLHHLLKDEKFNATYDRRRGLWKTGGYTVQVYDSLLKVNVSKDITPHKKGQVVFTGGVTYQAETGRASTTIAAGQAVWAVARYGNTLLVVDQQSTLLQKILL